MAVSGMGQFLEIWKDCRLSWLGKETKALPVVQGPGLKILLAFSPQAQGPRPSEFKTPRTPVLCKGVLMAATTWGPQTREPHCSWWLWGPRRGKEKLALTLQNNAARWGGVVGGPHKEVSVRRVSLCTMAPQKPVPGGKQRISIDMT